MAPVIRQLISCKRTGMIDKKCFVHELIKNGALLLFLPVKSLSGVTIL